MRERPGLGTRIWDSSELVGETIVKDELNKESRIPEDDQRDRTLSWRISRAGESETWRLTSTLLIPSRRTSSPCGYDQP